MCKDFAKNIDKDLENIDSSGDNDYNFSDDEPSEKNPDDAEEDIELPF